MARFQVGGSASASGVGTVTTLPFFVVETKASWGGSWTRRSYVEPIRATDAVAPAVSTAIFRYNYGRIKREDKTTFAVERELDLLNGYIRIVRLSAGGSKPIFTGSVDADSLSIHGGGAGSGVQEFQAYGLALELDREAIHSAQVDQGGTVEIDWVPDINRKFERGEALFGNRSDQKNSDEVYEFSVDGAEWTNYDVAEMILKRYTPDNGPTFKLGGQSELLAGTKEIHELEGQTAWTALNRVISRRRGLGFKIVVQGDTVVVWVFSVLDETLSVGGVQVDKNPSRYTLDLDTSIKIQSNRIVRSIATRYDRVIARMERAVVCASFSYADGTLEEGWPASLEVAYRNASKEMEGYGDLSGDQQATRNDRYRREDIFSSVFCKHRVPLDFDGNAGDGEGGESVPMLPVASGDGSVVLSDVSAAPWWRHGKHFEKKLPIEEGLDYSQSPPKAMARVSGDAPKFRDAFFVCRDSSGSYHYTEKPSDSYERAAASIEVVPHELAVKIQPNIPQLYGRTFIVFPPASGANAERSLAGSAVFDYGDLVLTAAIRVDAVPHVILTRKGFSDSARTRTRVIQVPGAEYWAIAPNTVVGVDAAGDLLRYEGNGVLRDDMGRVREIAAYAMAWYGKVRRSVEVTVVALEELVPLGSILAATVTAGVARDTNTVVSSIAYDFPAGTTTVRTMWAEFDWSG